jgi:hypothetical protein
MNLYTLKDGTIINLDAIQSIAPITNNGFNLYVFRINLNNHWVDVCENTRDETKQLRDTLINSMKGK